MAISSIGVGSGLPLDQLLADIEKSERQSLSAITARSTREKTRLSAYGTIKSGIEALQKAAETLSKADTYGASKTSGGGDFFTATSKAGATAGQYSVNVQQLATSQSLRSASAQTSRNTALVAADVNIEVTLANGEKTTLTVAAADTSLDGIMKALNNNTDAGVSSTLVNANAGDTENPEYYMLFNARGTGTQAAVQSITVTAADGTSDVSALSNVIGFNRGTPDLAPADPGYTAPSGALIEETAAKNALVEINGISITSQNNTIENAIEGVTLSLTKETTTAQTLTVSADNSVTTKAVEAFVTAYNNLQNTIKSLTSYNTETQTGSALTGDSLARRVQGQMRQALTSGTGSEGISNLSQLGITTDPLSGTLKIDNTKLTAALGDNMAGVQDLFAGTTGISSTIKTAADTFVKSGGIISSATDGVNRSIKALEEQYSSASERIDNRMAIYRAQFQQLDVMMSQMNATSSYLNQQLSALANLNSSSNSK